jgi:hypothetical protein
LPAAVSGPRRAHGSTNPGRSRRRFGGPPAGAVALRAGAVTGSSSPFTAGRDQPGLHYRPIHIIGKRKRPILRRAGPPSLAPSELRRTTAGPSRRDGDHLLHASSGSCGAANVGRRFIAPSHTTIRRKLFDGPLIARRKVSRRRNKAIASLGAQGRLMTVSSSSRPKAWSCVDACYVEISACTT